MCEKLGHPFFFFHLASNVFPDVGWVGWIEKKHLKKTQEVLEWKALVPQDDIKSEHSHIWIFRMHNIL